MKIKFLYPLVMLLAITSRPINAQTEIVKKNVETVVIDTLTIIDPVTYKERYEFKYRKVQNDAVIADTITILQDDNMNAKNEKKVTIDVNKKNRKKFKNFTDLNFSFGVNTLIENDYVSAVKPDIELMKSWYFDIGLMFKSKLSRLGSESKRTGLFLKYGVNFIFNEYEYQNPVLLVLNGSQPSFVTIFRSDNFDKISLRTRYLQVPILLDLDTKNGNGFKFSIGGFGGVRLKSKQTIEYTTLTKEEVKEERTAQYGINDLQFGLMGSIGYKWLHFRWQYQVSSLFKENDTYDYRPFNVGLLFTI